MSVTVSGVDGKLYWGYYLVGTVRGWTAARGSPADPGSLTATIVNIDTYRASQHPIVFVVQHKHGVWRWPLLSLQIADGTLSGVLGPPET